MGRKQVVLEEDEMLAMEVRKFPVLYDKSNSQYKEKRPKLNAWRTIDETLGFEEGDAEDKFGKLKTRYSRRKTALKKAKRSGTGRTAGLEAAEAALRSYDFLKWLDPFVSGAESLSNLNDPVERDLHLGDENSEEMDFELPYEHGNDGDDIPSDEEEEDNESVGENVEAHDENSGSKENSASIKQDSKIAKGKIIVESTNGAGSTSSKSVVKNPPRAPLAKMPDGIPSFKKAKVSTDELLATINKRLHEKKQRREKIAPVEEDPEETFGKMVAQKLRSLSKRRQIKLEHDINTAIFKYVCEEEDERAEKEQQQNLETQKNLHRPYQQQPMIEIPKTDLSQGSGNYVFNITDPRIASPAGSNSSFSSNVSSPLNLPNQNLVSPTGSTSYPPSPYNNTAYSGPYCS